MTESNPPPEGTPPPEWQPEPPPEIKPEPSSAAEPEGDAIPIQPWFSEAAKDASTEGGAKEPESTPAAEEPAPKTETELPAWSSESQEPEPAPAAVTQGPEESGEAGLVTEPEMATGAVAASAVEAPVIPQPAPPPAPPPAATPQPLSGSEERTWAMLAHLSILLNLITGFLGIIAAFIIYLVYKDRSRFVAYHAMQSFVFQLIFWAGAGLVAVIAWTISGLLAAILIGCLCMPIALLISLVPLGALVYSVIGAIQVNQGKDFKYWLVGDWVRDILTG